MLQQDLLNDLTINFNKSLREIKILAIRYDKELLLYLLEESIYKDEFKSRFFIKINQNCIFKLDDFITFLNLNILDNSYTQYSNKIGLASKNKFLKASNEVVLNFAFKDCVLKGGQSKDEMKSQEIFFNEILAKDEIDVLFSPKALHNFELISTNNEMGGGIKTF